MEKFPKPKRLIDINASLPKRLNLFSRRSVKLPLIKGVKIFFIISAVSFLLGLVQAPSNTNYISSAQGIQSAEQERMVLEQQLKELEKQMEEYQGQIETYQTKGKTLKNEIAILEAKIKKLNLQIKSIEINLANLKQDIASAQTKINSTEIKIESQKKALTYSLLNIYETDV